MVKKPKTTLYMLMSMDGKISTGSSDSFDFDKDLPKIKGAREGLRQYYDIEKTTDIVSFNSGKVQAKVGINTRPSRKEKINCTFVIVDNKPHLKSSGIRYFLESSRGLVLVTTNKNHPAFKIKDENLRILYYPNVINFKNLFGKLYTNFGFKRITIQTGGTLNTTLIREGLIDRISIVIAPCLVGGKDTATLMDGKSIAKLNELKDIKALKLEKVEKLKDSYLHLIYSVLN